MLDRLVTALYQTDGTVIEGKTADHALATVRQVGIDANLADLLRWRAEKQQQVRGALEEQKLLETIAGVVAYYQVSSKRLIEEVPMWVEEYLLNAYCKRAKQMPVELLAPAGQRSATGAESNQQPDPAQLMTEDRTTAKQRAEIQKKLDQLHEVRKILNSF